MFGEVWQAFIKESPVAVMVRGLLENLLDAEAKRGATGVVCR